LTIKVETLGEPRIRVEKKKIMWIRQKRKEQGGGNCKSPPIKGISWGRLGAKEGKGGDRDVLVKIDQGPLTGCEQ